MSDDWEAQEDAFFGEAISSSTSTSTSRSKSMSLDAGKIHNKHATKNVNNNNNNSMIDLLKEKAYSLNHLTHDRLRQFSNNIPSQYPAAAARNPPPNSSLLDNDNDCKPSSSAPMTSFRAPSAQPPINPTNISRNTSTNNIYKKITKKALQMQKHLSNQITVAIHTNHCIICGTFAPSPYKYHPFFPSERICAAHNECQITKCTACQRFEPGIGSGREEFSDLQDNDRKLCPACLRTVIVDSQDAIPLWSSVVDFLDIQLGVFFTSLDAAAATAAVAFNNNNDNTCGVGGKSNGGNLEAIKFQMKSIPILIVNHEGLNDPYVKGSGHGQGNTRGLCMYEYRQLPTFLARGKKESIGGGRLKDFLDSKRKQSSSTSAFQTILTSFANTATSTIQQHLRSSRITAILCLKGLPRDLVSSILAHEATHAWFKLHPSFDPIVPIPLKVEEGCCQLVAFIYLSHLEEHYNIIGNGDDYDGNHGKSNYYKNDQPSNLKLCQYFRHCIETDTSEIYGDGFRLAAEAYSKCNSVATVLEHVVAHKCFPSFSL